MESRPRSERGVLRLEGTVFGRSVLGAPLEVFEPAESGAEVLVLAGTHGEEGEAVTVLSAALRSLPDGALACPVVLALNPDGLARGTRGNARGVDLNRNLPTSTWRPGPVCYRWTLEDERDVELSPGDAPASEPETAALLQLLERLRPAVVLSLHAPLACVDDPESTELGLWLADRANLPHVAGVPYPTPGSLGTWGGENDVAVITYELPRASTEELVRRHAPVIGAVLAGVTPGTHSQSCMHDA